MTLTQKAMIGAGLGLVAFLAAKGFKGAGAAAGAAAVDMVDGVLSGAVVGAGSVVGIPATNQTQCQVDTAKGDTWAASFSCPAKDFISWWWNK